MHLPKRVTIKHLMHTPIHQVTALGLDFIHISSNPCFMSLFWLDTYTIRWGKPFITALKNILTSILQNKKKIFHWHSTTNIWVSRYVSCYKKSNKNPFIIKCINCTKKRCLNNIFIVIFICGYWPMLEVITCYL